MSFFCTSGVSTGEPRAFAHVGPINMTCVRGHDDAVGEMAIATNGLAVGAVDIHRVNAVAAQFEKE
ncbi:MAG: hypothetical protein J2P54_20690 [Bradyrhizobiaceae bacterium]|nr:hypothetical protein [Bradyrhizobiaceae bacterium]